MSPLWMYRVGSVLNVLNYRYDIDSWAYGAEAQIRSQQNVNYR